MSNTAFLWDFLFSVWGISVWVYVCERFVFRARHTTSPANVYWRIGCTDDKHWLAGGMGGGNPPPRWPPVILVSGYLCPCVASSNTKQGLTLWWTESRGKASVCCARSGYKRLCRFCSGSLGGSGGSQPPGVRARAAPGEARVERAEAAPEFLAHRNHEMIDYCGCCSHH